MLPCTLLVLFAILVSSSHGFAQKNADTHEQQVLDELLNAFHGEDEGSEHFMAARSSIRLDVLQSSAPTFATTSSPSFAPSFHHTFAPSFSPSFSDAPSHAPTFAPSFESHTPTEAPTEAPTHAPSAPPTVAPTQAPSAPPTVSPTQAPSAAPTITRSPTFAPTQASPLILSFNNYYTMSGLNTTILSAADQQAVINAQANVTKISPSYISYVKAYFATTSRRLTMSKQATASDVVVVTLSTLPMADFPTYTTDTLYTTLTTAVNTAVTDGTYTAVLQNQAVTLGATTMTTASTSTVTFSEPAVTSTDQSDDDDDGLSGGAIAGIVIGVVVFVALLIFGGYYYYVNYYINAHPAAPLTKTFENEL